MQLNQTDFFTDKAFTLTRKQFYVLIILLLIAWYFPIFYWLERLPLSIFDEAHVAVNAIELNWGKPWLTTYNGSPEMWNLKPPLLPWMQRLLMYVVGYNTLAIRLPSALATLASCFLFLFFSRKIFKNYLPGITASLVLVTTPGFIRDHIARNGDYDALLSFFILATFLLAFIYIYTDQKKYLYMAGAALLGGILTKGIAAVIFTPAILLFCIYEKKLGYFFKQRSFYLTAIAVFAVAALYYILRDAATPGYFKKVVDGEWKGIPMTVVQGHSGPWWYYFDYFFYSGFSSYVLLLLAGLVTYIALRKNTLYHKIAVYCLLFFIIQLGVLSIATSKLPWYDAPAYPIAALLTGIFIFHIISQIINYIKSISVKTRPVVLYTFLMLAFFTWPYVKIMQYIVNEPASNWSPLLYEAYMKDLRQENPKMKNYIIGYASNNEQVVFFSRAYNKQFGYNIDIQDAWQPFKSGDTIVSCEKFTLDTLSVNFEYKILHQQGDCTTFTLLQPKQKL